MPEPRLPARVRRAVIRRARECCEYCRSQVRFAPDPFSVEHIVPRATGGGDETGNLALSCQGCNNRKYVSVDALDPVSGETAPLYHPRRQRWSDHFAWTEEFTLVMGLMLTGRATIEKLQLNREGVVNLRRALHAIGRHPPPEAGE
jgi:5-methylcytosine-specific restriction endonuclease McrA